MKNTQNSIWKSKNPIYVTVITIMILLLLSLRYVRLFISRIFTEQLL